MIFTKSIIKRSQVLQFIAILAVTFGVLITNNAAKAEDSCADTKKMECFPIGASQNDTYAYYCVENVLHCTTLLKGTVVDQTGQKCNELGTKNTCCQLPLCVKSATGATGSGGSTSPAPVPQTGSSAEWDYNDDGVGLQLVRCAKTGKCEIKDLVQQGIYFADFLIGLSGALFLIAFIWGGAMYLLSFGRTEWVTKGRDAMVKSSIGIVFIMLAWTIVTYVAQSLGYTGL
jgi:hypothetical protein